MKTRTVPMAVIGAILILTLAFTGGFVSFPLATSMAAEWPVNLIEGETDTLQQQRVELIRELRAANLADFAAMEQVPGLYTQQESASVIGRDRVTAIQDLRAQNLADFDAMEQWPGLYT